MTRRLVLAVAGVGLVLLVAFWFLAWKPTSHQLKSAHGRLTQAQSLQTTLRAQVAGLESARKKESTYRSELSALKAAIPSSPSIAGIVDQLSQDASASGVSLPSLAPSLANSNPAASSPSAKTKGPAVSTVQLGLSVDGTYPQIVNFVNRLNSSPRLFVVKQVSMSAGTGNHAMAASLQVDAFYTGSSNASES